MSANGQSDYFIIYFLSFLSSSRFSILSNMQKTLFFLHTTHFWLLMPYIKKNVIYICYLLFTFISYALPSVIHARGKMYVDILYAFCMTCQRWWIDIDVYKELAHIQINSLIFSALTSIWKKTTLKWKRTLNIDLSFTRFVQAHGEKLKKGR